MAKIQRSGSKGVRRAAKAQGRAAGARRAKAQTSGIAARAMALLPFDERQWSRIFATAILAVFLLIAGFIANLAGVPALAQAEMARMASRAGFEARIVRITGTERLKESEVYGIAMAQRDRAMPLVDIEGLRAELLALSWVEDARVSVQLPDILAIDIVEREPYAALVRPDHLVLVDLAGNELSPISQERAKGMLQIAGPGAAAYVSDLDRLLASAPALAPHVTGAEWIGNRRWDIAFRSGQTLALPEGEERAAKALVQFARLDGQNRLIGGKVSVFDMRNPPRIFMRVPGRSERLLLSQEAS